jgi:hypothetical protein
LAAGAAFVNRRLACRRGLRYGEAEETPMRSLLLSLTIAGSALPALAQQGTMTLDQIERKYRNMSPVHIEKCDYDGDGVFTRTEQLCVAGIYQQMYQDRD